MTQIGTAYVKVVADTDELKSGLSKGKSSLSGFAGSLGAIAPAAAGAGVAIGVAADFLWDSVKAAEESQKVQIQLERQVNATGESYDQYAKQIDDTITKTSNLAAVDDEELAASFTKLVGSTGDVNVALKGMQEATDLAAARGVSLETATKAVEKALNGSVGGLKRYGITLDKNASRAEVMAALQKRFGGAAEAYGKTAAGAQERFGVALENVKEQIGTALLPAVTKFFNAVSDGLIWWQANWPQIEKAIQKTWVIVGPIFESIFLQIKYTARIIADVARLINAIANGEWGEAWKQLKNLAMDAFRLLLVYIENLPIVRAIRFVIDKAIGALTDSIQGVKNAAAKIGDAIVDGVKAYLDFYAGLGSLILGQIRRAAAWVLDNFGAPFAGVVKHISNAVDDVLDFGVSLGQKILAGIRAAARYVIDNVAGAFAGLGSAIKRAVLDQLAGIGDWIRDQIARLPGAGLVGGAIGKLPGLRSAPAPPTAAVAAGAGGSGGVAAARGASFGGGTLGSGTGAVGPLRVPGLGRIAQLDTAPLQVRVFIGDTELTQIVRTEVGRSDTAIARSVLAGARA